MFKITNLNSFNILLLFDMTLYFLFKSKFKFIFSLNQKKDKFKQHKKEQQKNILLKLFAFFVLQFDKNV